MFFGETRSVKKKLKNPPYYRFEDILRESENDEFEIGQCYEETPAKRLECVKCGSKQFIVGCGNYYTAIKCPNCLWEYNIHEG